MFEYEEDEEFSLEELDEMRENDEIDDLELWTTVGWKREAEE